MGENPFVDNKITIAEAVEFYKENGYRPIPIFSVEDGCKCSSEKCADQAGRLQVGQCWGKVPTDLNWFDKVAESKDFNEKNNIALLMGRQTNRLSGDQTSGRWLVAFDVDGDLDLSDHFDLPETLEQKTGRGSHFIFEVPYNTALGNWNNLLMTRDKKTGYKKGFAGALDIKYARGALIVAPSIHKSGKQYQWVNYRDPAILPYDIISKMIWLRKKAHPKVKRYFSWTASPSHKNKKP